MPLTIEQFNLNFACSDEEEYFAKFQKVFYAVSYVHPKEKSKLAQKWFDIIMNTYIYILQNIVSHNNRIPNIQKYINIHRDI